jgi:deoxycytidine triphosphate deaminase
MAVLNDVALSDLYPHYRGAIGPASIDLAIGDRLLAWPKHIRRDPVYKQDLAWKPEPFWRRSLWDRLRDSWYGLPEPHGAVWRLKPGVRYLATTRDPIRIPEDAAGQIGARSSWGRDGLAVIQGPAGFLDPNYEGRPTLELSVSGSELVLWPGAAIAQLIVHQLTSFAARPYGHPSRRSKYQGDLDPTASRTHLECSGGRDAKTG